MDVGKRISETACAICALVAVYDLGDRHKWWPVNLLIDLGSYVSPICVLVACGACLYMLQRNTKLERQLKSENPVARLPEFWQWIGQMNELVLEALELKTGLEILEYEWTKNGEALIYPLSYTTIPEVGIPLSYRMRELLGYRFLYRHHVQHVKDIDKDFHSTLVDQGFPAEIDCLMAKRVLERHVEALKEHIANSIRQVSSSSEAL